MNVLIKPFVLLRLNLEILEFQNYDELSESDYRRLSLIQEKIVDFMGEGKIANLYIIKLKTSNQIVLDDIRLHMDYDTQIELEEFKSNLYKNLSLDQQVRKYIEVFEPLVDKLHKHHFEMIKIINEVKY